ncbi:MAG TPA: methionine--tRNA ligase subunit beta [Candidatus Paceibacterota bacterium]|nr:methionine--tRNA ligase subunit beta [Candidatus Paceibacterota bacterium]
MINYDQFKTVELKVVRVIEAEKVEGSEKLLKLMVNDGTKDEAGIDQPRQIVSGIAKWYAPEDMVGKNIVIVANLEPRQLMGLESNGMILAAGSPPALLIPDQDVEPGTLIN